MERLTTSKEAADMLQRLNRSTGIRANYWARAGLGMSLGMDALPGEPEQMDSEGREFSRAVLLGGDQPALMALLRQRHGMALDDTELARVVKLHIERGVRLIYHEFERLNRRGDELLLSLLRRCMAGTGVGVKGPADREKARPESCEIGITLGADAGTGKPVTYVLNRPGTSPHVAVMGRTRSGKTRTALNMLSEVARTSSSPVPCLVFDYAKGDIATNAEFVKALGATVIRLPEQRIPLAPLALPQHDEYGITMAAHRFRDTIGSVVRSLGPKQKTRCLDIIRGAYDEVGPETLDLGHVVDVARRLYDQNEWPEDSLLACLREFVDFPLFRPAVLRQDHDLLSKPYVFDIHDLPEDLRKLSVFLVLDRLYWEVMQLDEAPLDKQGNRELRLIIVIDEAHNYLPCKQPTLQKMVREVASKGIAVWLLSQSPDDFDQPSYNFAREMGLAMVFSCVLEKPRMLEALLGGKVNPQRLSQLPAGVALTRLPGTEKITEVQVWRPGGTG